MHIFDYFLCMSPNIGNKVIKLFFSKKHIPEEWYINIFKQDVILNTAVILCLSKKYSYESSFEVYLNDNLIYYCVSFRLHIFSFLNVESMYIL